MSNIFPVENEDTARKRYEILAEFKRLLTDQKNQSPFVDGTVVRYDSDVSKVHVKAIHAEARKRICELLKDIQAGKEPQVVLLVGEPGMGKTHLINTFRPRIEAEERGYILVCNSNHWRAEEFEECLLNWILGALLRPTDDLPIGEISSSPEDRPHLLMEKIRFLAYAFLDQILSEAGLIRHYRAAPASWWIPFIGKLFRTSSKRRCCVNLWTFG